MMHPPPNKALGQHYLHHPHYQQKITQACLTGLDPLPPVLEIGPGPGALTQNLLAAGCHVTAIEKDERFLEPLQALSANYDNRLHVVHGDALALDITDLVPAGAVLAGNLPYNVGTEIVVRAVRYQRRHFRRMVFMLQKEVVQRICAQPNTTDWGRLAVWCHLYMQRYALFDVPAGAFQPPPKVTSAVVELTARPEPLVDINPARLEMCLNLLFTQRRKMLRRILKNRIDDTAFNTLNFPSTARPGELTTEQICALAECM